MRSLEDDTDLQGSLGHISIWRRARVPTEARLALPSVGYGFIYQASVARVKVELRDSEGDFKVDKVEVRPGMYELVREFRLDEARVRLQNLFWNNEPVTLILPTMQGGDKKYVGGNSWTLGLKLSKAACWLPNSRSHVSRSSSKYMLSLSLSFAVSINGKFMNLSDSRGGNAA